MLIFLVWQYHLERVQDAASQTRDYPSPGSRYAFLSHLALRWIPTPPPIMKMSLWTRAHGRVAVVFCVAFLNWCCFQGWIYWVVVSRSIFAYPLMYELFYSLAVLPKLRWLQRTAVCCPSTSYDFHRISVQCFYCSVC